MEKTGSSEYKRRRVAFRLEKTWRDSPLSDRKLFLFLNASIEVQESVLSKVKLESDDLPILLSFTDFQDWCLLSNFHLVFQNEGSITKVPLDKIGKISSCWGKMDEKDRVEICRGMVKTSPWLAIETVSGNRFEVFLWDKPNFMDSLALIQALNRIHPRQVTE